VTEAAQPLTERSRFSEAWAVLRGRELPPASDYDTSVSFPELVWAHRGAKR